MDTRSHARQALDAVESHDAEIDGQGLLWDGPTIYDEMQRDRRYGLHAVARHTDPETSHKAAHSVTGITESQARVLALVKQFGPLSDPEIRHRWQEMVDGGDYPPITDSGLRTRRAELVRRDKLRDSGVRTKTPSGRECIVWEAS